MTSLLTGEYEKIWFDFNKIFTGVEKIKPRWQGCVSLTNKHLPLAVGALYIQDNFNEENKVRTNF